MLLKNPPTKQALETESAALVHRPKPMWKRIFDVVVGSLLIIALSPILIALAIYVRLVSKGPSLFCQSRLGEMGEYFTIYKFRTLEIRDEATAEHRDYVANLQNSDAVLEKPDLEDRLIPGGDFLRGHSLDELPQLFNVILGNMTLVGPRPEVLHWDDYEPWQLRRLEATPGMTGLWQVSGKNRLTFNQMVELDIEYIRTRSFFGDIRILLRTFRVVFLKDD